MQIGDTFSLPVNIRYGGDGSVGAATTFNRFLCVGTRIHSDGKRTTTRYVMEGKCCHAHCQETVTWIVPATYPAPYIHFGAINRKTGQANKHHIQAVIPYCESHALQSHYPLYDGTGNPAGRPELDDVPLHRIILAYLMEQEDDVLGILDHLLDNLSGDERHRIVKSKNPVKFINSQLRAMMSEQLICKRRDGYSVYYSGNMSDSVKPAVKRVKPAKSSGKSARVNEAVSVPKPAALPAERIMPLETPQKPVQRVKSPELCEAMETIDFLLKGIPETIKELEQADTYDGYKRIGILRGFYVRAKALKDMVDDPEAEADIINFHKDAHRHFGEA